MWQRICHYFFSKQVVASLAGGFVRWRGGIEVGGPEGWDRWDRFKILADRGGGCGGGMVGPQTAERGVENKVLSIENKKKSGHFFCVLLTYSYLCRHFNFKHIL